MVSNDCTCVVNVDKFRALLCIAFPFITIATFFLVYTLNGFVIADYFKLIEAGTITWYSQMGGLAGVIIWFVVPFRLAVHALRNSDCAGCVRDGKFYFFGNFICVIDDVSGVFNRVGFLRNDLYIKTVNHEINADP